MADFCQQCSIRVFGKDMKDFDNLCNSEETIKVLCEGCGVIWIDKDGKRIVFNDEEQSY